MYVVDEGGIGRDIAGGTFGAISFGVIDIVVPVFLVIVAQFGGDVEHDIAVVVDEMAALGKARDTVAEGECCVTSIHLVTVDEFDGVVADDGTR